MAVVAALTGLFVLASIPCPAQEPGPTPATPATAPSATAPAADGAVLLAPFIDRTTTFVAEIDLERCDAAAVERWVIDALHTTYTRPEMREAKLGRAEPWLTAIRELMADLGALGARRLYVVSPVLGGAAPSIVVPIEPGMDPEDVRQRLAEAYGISPVVNPRSPSRMNPLAPTAVVADGVVAVGVRVVMEFLAEGGGGGGAGAAARGDVRAVRDAMAAVPNADVRIVVLPSPELRLTVQNLLARAEDDGSVPRGTAQQLPHDARWVAIGLHTPPDESARLVARATDLAAARRLGDATAALLGWLRQTPAEAQQGVAEVRPLVEGEELRVELAGEVIGRVLAMDVAPLLRGQSEDVLRGRVMARGQQIAKAIRMYAMQHGGEAPADLAALVDRLGMPDAMLANPRRPELEVGYAYVPAAADALTRPAAGGEADEQLLLYEVHEEWPAGGLVVVFADGRAGVIEDQARFQELLDAGRPEGAARD